jgi:hypothetical protein
LLEAKNGGVDDCGCEVCRHVSRSFRDSFHRDCNAGPILHLAYPLNPTADSFGFLRCVTVGVDFPCLWASICLIYFQNKFLFGAENPWPYW